MVPGEGVGPGEEEAERTEDLSGPVQLPLGDTVRPDVS